MFKGQKNQLKIFILVVLVVLLGVISITQGSVKIPVDDVVNTILKTDAADAIKPSHQFIITSIRLPRILLAGMVGGILSIVGVVFQAIFKNPMADPYVMGVSAGASFGATLGIVFGIGVSFLGMGVVSMMAFIGALGTMFIVYFLANGVGRISTTAILLAGVVMNAILSSLVSFMMMMFHNDIDKIVTWTMGSFNAASWEYVKLLVVPMTLGLIYLLSISRELNAMMIGEEEAKNTGVNVEAIKRNALIIASLMMAFSVSVSGIIGFVGLIVPHLLRILFGYNHKILLPVSFLGGASFMIICDTFARSAMENMEIPVGIITSMIGGPFFLMLLYQQKKKNVI